MDDAHGQASEFEQHRSHLQAVAYRMLGSLTEAEDAVQESWFRLNRSETSQVENMRAWLTTVVARVCLDMLRARRSRREDYGGGELPEPLVTLPLENGPEDESILADSVGLALLVVLDTLTPAERLAFVLHDMFGMPFEEIAPIVERSPAATRQLASRARRRVRGATPATEPDVKQQRRVVDAFLAASREGDFEALVAVLDPEVVFRADRGRLAFVGSQPVVSGAAAVAEQILARAPTFARFARPAIVNGAAGLIVVSHEKLIAVLGFTVSADRIVELDLVADPEKLAAADQGHALTEREQH
ncbi:MAG TPA: RNA polymerase sigma factor SigJ [Gaiellaceae bacterium]|nr:RNA polymerase sigma factor SigJ [Gaiellaceae bacterium]